MTKRLSLDGRIRSDYFPFKFISKILFTNSYFPNKKNKSKFV